LQLLWQPRGTSGGILSLVSPAEVLELRRRVSDINAFGAHTRHGVTGGAVGLIYRYHPGILIGSFLYISTVVFHTGMG
jgi:hypothetical protein